MSESTWITDGEGDWADAQNWSPAGVPGVNSDVMIATGSPVASASIGTVNSITDSSDLSFESAGTNTVTTFLDDTFLLYVDDQAGEGGTILNIGGTLTNSGYLSIGNTTLSASDEVTTAALDNTGEIHLTGSGADQALLDVTGSAGFGSAGVVTGDVRVDGDSAIEFASGEITSLAADAQLHLNGKDAFIDDSTALGSNSALTRLDSIGTGAYFALHNRAAVSTTGSLVNKGHIRLDFDGGDGGASLTLAGALTNSGSLSIGNTTLSGSDKVTASSLDNKGSISLAGSSANQALLDVTTGVAGFGTAGVLSGNVGLAGDGAIEFATGEITSLAAHAQLGLNGSDAFIEDSTVPGSNSALTGLASIGAGATFDLADAAAVSTSGALVNNGFISLDVSNTSTIIDDGGSSLTVGGTLTNTGELEIGGDDYDFKASDTVAAAALDNMGSINVSGGHFDQTLFGPALLDVTTGPAGFGTAGTLTGSVEVADGAIEFLGGQINTIARGADLQLFGTDAFIEDSTALGSNSALTGLSNISGGLDIEEGGAVSTTGALTNTGFLNLDVVDSLGESSLTVGGALTNTDTGTLRIGGGGLASSSSVTATSFVNSGEVDLNGDMTNALNVSGATTNNGSISITDDTEELAGAVGGSGSFSLYGYGEFASDLLFDSSVSSGQTIDETGANNETGADGLILKQAQKFAGTISGFGTGDTIDATNFLKTATTYDFGENLIGTGGTLSLRDGSLTANILMSGDYSKSSFTLAPDSGTGTLVKFA